MNDFDSAMFFGNFAEFGADKGGCAVDQARSPVF